MPVATAKMFGIEDDVFGRKADLFRQKLVGARADGDFALDRVGLALLVERHHHDGRAIGAHQLAPDARNSSSPSFMRDRIDDRLALHAFQPGLDHRAFRRIDHHRHARDIGLGGDEIEKLDHGRLRVDQALVHVDVDDLRAVRDLIARDVERAGIVAGGDQFAELGRAGDVGALADIDEWNVGRERERLEAGEAHQRHDFRRRCAACERCNGLGDGANMVRASCRSSRRRC